MKRPLLIVAALVVPIVGGTALSFVVIGGRQLGLALGAVGVAVIAFIAVRAVPQQRLERPDDAADEIRRLLVVGDETLTDPRVADAVVARIGGAEPAGRGLVLVVAPVLSSRVARWTSATDADVGAAIDRLDAFVEALLTRGVLAEGRTGDEDPRQAIADALRGFAADEIVISTHPAGRSEWVRDDVPGQLRRVSPVPVVHLAGGFEAPATGREPWSGVRASPLGDPRLN